MCTQVASNEDVDVVIEPAATTAERLGTTTDPAEVKADGWLTIAPQTGIVNDEQVRNGRDPVFGADETIARSPLVFAGPKERLQKLTDRCRASIEWVCLAGVADQRWIDVGGEEDWGQVKLGHADPKTNTVGLLAVGQEATSKLGTNDFTSTEPGRRRIRHLVPRARAEREARRGRWSACIAVAVRHRDRRRAGLRSRGVQQAPMTQRTPPRSTSSYPRRSRLPTWSLRRSAAADASDAARAAATGEAARSALTKGSWRVGDDTNPRKVCGAVGPVQLTRSNNVPAAGVLVALRDKLPRNG